MKPSRHVQALADIKTRALTRLSVNDPELAKRIENALPLQWYSIRNAAEEKPNEDGENPPSKEDDEDDVTDVLIYDEIGGSLGVQASQFIEDIGNIKTKNINVRINSPGGSLFDGIAIYNALMRHPSNITTIVDGIAASAASIIAMGGDTVEMMPGSQIMIHDAMGILAGNAADMQAMAVFLDKQSDNIAGIYAYKTEDQSEEAIKNWRTAMLAETWYMANEAVESGLADRVYIKPKTQRDDSGEPLEADVEVDEDGNPIPPEEDEGDDTKDEAPDIEAMMARRHKVRNSKYKDRRNAPDPYMPVRVTSAIQNGQFDVSAFVRMAKEGK